MFSLCCVQMSDKMCDGIDTIAGSCEARGSDEPTLCPIHHGPYMCRSITGRICKPGNRRAVLFCRVAAGFRGSRPRVSPWREVVSGLMIVPADLLAAPVHPTQRSLDAGVIMAGSECLAAPSRPRLMVAPGAGAASTRKRGTRRFRGGPHRGHTSGHSRRSAAGRPARPGCRVRVRPASPASAR